MNDSVPGTALLLAASPAGKAGFIDATSVLPALAAVSPSILTGTTAATIVELADPVDPQTVLTRIRAAATTPGPLTLFLVGQLHLDSKQHQVHFALARTTEATLRYSALPWHWLASELRPRKPGSTTVVADLIATPDTWQRIREDGLTIPRGIRLYGRVAPQLSRRRTAEPAYLKAVAAIWRSGSNPPLAQLHEQAAAQARLQDGSDGGALDLAVDGAPLDAVPPATSSLDTAPLATTAPQAGPAPSRRPPQPAPENPLPTILAAAGAGRHSEAAALASMWEEWALRTHGAGSAQAVHWLEIRADLARLAGDPARSCELWMSAADARLARQQLPDDPAVVDAVDRAHHQWQELQDPRRAQELGPALAALRGHVPGQRAGAVAAVRHRLEVLHGTRPRVDGGAGT
ncbi:hypothetical protein ACIRJR_30850 [Streptomyces sp. NPDC102402]|uniref:hypothetical protein n=1 Tax=Streptomyces sp. NPDC102402 TaxID=3366169 RepID=UPI003830880F